jgi:heterotetrameric sarcosine oxidase gamma subunit
MTLEFLSPVPGEEPEPRAPAAASPLEPSLSVAGATFEARDGWRVPIDFGSPAEEAEACQSGVGIAERSAIGKLEVQGAPAAIASLLDRLFAAGPEDAPAPGSAAPLDDGLLWRSSPDRVLAICEPAATPRLRARLRGACEASPGCGLVELTAGLAAIELRGPKAPELLERLTAIDVRDRRLPVGGVRGGAVAEVPATLLRIADEAFLVLVAAPEAPDAWEIALDAGAPLGLRPVGERARAEHEQPRREAAIRA